MRSVEVAVVIEKCVLLTGWIAELYRLKHGYVRLISNTMYQWWSIIILKWFTGESHLLEMAYSMPVFTFIVKRRNDLLWNSKQFYRNFQCTQQKFANSAWHVDIRISCDYEWRAVSAYAWHAFFVFVLVGVVLDELKCEKGIIGTETHEHMHLISIECNAAFKEYKVLYSNWPTFCLRYILFNHPFSRRLFVVFSLAERVNSILVVR